MAFLVVLALGACARQPGSQAPASPVPLTRVQDPGKTSIPFAFKGIYVAISKTSEESKEIAIKGEKWLVQLEGLKNRSVVVKTNAVYVIDHEKKTYHEPDDYEAGLLSTKDVESGNELETGIFAWSTFMFFRREELSQLEEISQIGNLVTFRKKNSRPDELITIDSNSGLIVKREFPTMIDWMEQGSFRTHRYELRSLSYEVDDYIFEIPEGYRLVTAAEARPTPSKP